MTKAELIQAVWDKTEGLNKREVGGVVDAMFAAIAGAVADDGRFAFPGFGTFTVRERAARTGRNPQTGKPIEIGASKTVAFKAAPKFKDSL